MLVGVVNAPGIQDVGKFVFAFLSCVFGGIVVYFIQWLNNR